MALNFGVSNLFPTSLEDGQVLFADGSRQGPAFATLTKATGTLSILATTDGYDTAAQFADVPFLKNELGVNNTIEIQVWFDNTGDKGVQYRIDLEDTTLNTVGTETSTGAGVTNLITDLITQGTNDTQEVIMRRLFVVGTTPGGYLRTPDSGDDNVFTTEFTLRLNFKKSDNVGSGTVKVKYLVLIHHS